MKGKILEGDRKVVISALRFRKIELHATVDVAIVSSIFLHFISDEFEHLPHAVLRHFLFSLFQFLEFSYQTAQNQTKILAFAPQRTPFLEQFLLGLCAILNKELYDFPKFIEPYLIDGRSPSGSLIGGNSSVFSSISFVDLCSLRLRTTGSGSAGLWLLCE